MLIALATLMFLSVSVLALAVIGHELRVRGKEMVRALGLDSHQASSPTIRTFRVIQRRRMAPIRLAERQPLRAAA